MAPKVKAEADDTGEPNAALVHAEVATCLTAPTQPLRLFVWPATVKFHARHLAVHKTWNIKCKFHSAFVMISSPVCKTGRRTDAPSVL